MIEDLSYQIEIYKKWHKTGFISISNWPTADKVKFEIATTTEDRKLKSLSTCYLPVYEFLTYLQAEVSGRVTEIFPEFAKTDKNHGWTKYSGSPKANPVIARLFKITDWNFKHDQSWTPSGSRRFKCGEFDGQVTNTGAVNPIWSKMHNDNSIKMSQYDIAELYQRLSASQNAAVVWQTLSGANKPEFVKNNE